MTKSTITRERLSDILEFGSGRLIKPISDEEIELMARMALAALDSEPVAWISQSNLDALSRGHDALVKSTDNVVQPVPLYRHAQQPVVPFGLHPDTQKLVIDFCTALAEKLYKAQLKYGYDADWKQDGWPSQCQAHFHQHIAKGDPRDVAAYCAFMWYHSWKTEAAQTAPVVTFYRDGIEAAAKWIDKQREAYDSEHGWSDPDTGAFEFGNDTQRGYSSTLEELAEGIRALHPNAGNSPVIPEGYVMVPKEPTAEMVIKMRYHVGGYDRNIKEGYKAMLAVAPQLPGSESATVPGKWIPVSERMPPSRHEVLVGCWWGEKPRWCCKWATYIPEHPDAQSSGWLIPGASWTPTHWMQLPAGPREVKGE